MSILNIGTRALQANQVALQTAGNNIANVNTPGYSRQTVTLQTVAGQFSGGGYIGKGVDVLTIQRNFSAFLTRQSTLASSVQAADVTRSDKLSQLEGIFAGGTSGLGASISDMLNAFSDVASAPTDLTARTVALTRVDETASRMRSASQSLDDLQQGVDQELRQKADAINTLARGIAGVNDEIARAQGTGQPPNDLLDRRDQLVRELNQYVQTTSIPADDGTVGIFLASSQALVLGTTVSPVSIVSDDFGDTLKNKLAITRNGLTVVLDENALGGGEVSGLLRFQNSDLVEGRNLLGRLTLAISTAMNDQHKLGLDLDGKPGGNLFTPTTFGTQNIRTPVAPATLNTGTASLALSVADTSKFAASDYEVTFSSATTGTITRRSDGQVTSFTQTLPSTVLATVDGLTIDMPSGTPSAGDRFLIKPFSTSASNIRSEFSSPRALAIASPWAGAMGTTNTGSLQQLSLVTRTNANPPPVVPNAAVKLTFTSPTTYTRGDEVPVANTTVFTYTPGEAIEATFPDLPATSPPTYSNPLTGWSVKLQGTPKAGDSYTVIDIKDTAYNVDLKLNAGNATAMMNLRDAALFDGAALTDGYASMISQIGIRSQSAAYAAEVSGSIATNLEKDRAGVSGVNLDEEAAKLLQYQQAYQASAKMIQIAQSIFDTLMQGLNR
jgi:flagellar hook-associated protein 1 FlgK